MTFTKTDDTYVDSTGRVRISDNGGGFGPARGSGRWALVVDGTWVANLDRLDEAKARATDLLAQR